MSRRRVVIVTGGAGSIGSVIAATLAAEGWAALVADLDRSAAEAVAERVGAAGAFAGDLTDESRAAALVDRAAALGTLTAVVNAAGISPKNPAGGKVDFTDVGADDFARVLAVNLLAPFLVVREAARVIARDGSGAVVNIGSITARLGSSGPEDAGYGPTITSGLHYSASKAALHNLGVSLSRELAPYRVRVNTVAPGYVSTAMTAGTPGPTEQAVLAQVPAGRAATPQDIADSVAFLLSERARYLNGAVLDVNGGWLPAQ